MVSTRHHPRAFPPPEEATSPPSTTSRRPPQTPTPTTSSSKATPDSPPPASTRRATSRKRKSVAPLTETAEDEIKQITAAAAQAAEDVSSALTTSMTTRSKDGTRSPRPTSTKSTKRGTGGVTGTYEHTPPPFLILWLLISLPLVAWDTIYILGRPHTMPGGRIHNYLWKPYALYGTIDYIYGWPAWDGKNGFTAAQGTLNVIESLLYAYYLWVIGTRVANGDGFVRGVALKSLNVFSRADGEDQSKIVVRGGSDVATAVLVCFASAVMTLSKTVLYWFNEYFSGFANIGHNAWSRLFWLWVVPNGAWIVLPVYMCWVLGNEVVEGLATTKGGRRRRRDHEDGE